jgi:hypothetical protein
MPGYSRIFFLSWLILVVLGTTADYILFNLRTAQGHVFVLALEILLQFAVCTIAAPAPDQKWSKTDKTSFTIALAFLTIVSMGYKVLFVGILGAAEYTDDLTKVFKFATGPLYGLAPIADGYIDAIANALYQCGVCVSEDQIPLNEPFIAYLFYGLSTIAGEFNQAILWLSLHTVTFLTAVILLKTAREVFPSIRHLWILPLLYIAIPDVHGVSLTLFKDGYIALVLTLLFYFQVRYIFHRNIARYKFEAAMVLLIVLLYQLRSGTLAVIFCMTFAACCVDKKNWLQHLRILVFAILSLAITSGDGVHTTEKLEKSLTRLVDKMTKGTSKHLDIQNLSYTISQESSLIEKLKLNEITASNFFYAPIVKGSLYFLLPLPVNQSQGLPDKLHKISTLFYAALFFLFLVGIYRIFSQRTPAELYLFAIFLMYMALILGAGPFIYPRYRTMVTAFFLLIAALGATHLSNRAIVLSVGGTIVGLTGLIFWYDEIYGIAQSLLQ